MKNVLITTLILFLCWQLQSQQINLFPDHIQLVDNGGEVYEIKLDTDAGMIFEADNAAGRNVLKLFDDNIMKIAVGQDETDNLNIINSQNYAHPGFASPQIMGDGDAPFIIASREGDTESAGIHGDGDAVTIWSPGDGAQGAGVGGYLFVLDEDRWTDDTNPYNGTALIAYMNTSGVWTVSDRNRKSNIKKFSNAISKVKDMNAYSYEYSLVEKEIEKGEKPIKAVGLMAQEIESIVPEAVNVTTNGDYFVNYNMITPVLVEALKEQQALIEELQLRITALENGN